MKSLAKLLANNQKWAKEILKQDENFFKRLSKIQRPEYLWIGCSDSRVPANEIVGLLPGELFVHRNVANLVVHTDLNCLSVIQYAVEVLKIKEIIVCGHYGCGGIAAALQNNKLGLIDNWLRHIQDVAKDNKRTLAKIKDTVKRSDKLCELNVLAQMQNVAQTSVIQNAWKRKEHVRIHGWIYGLKDGRLSELSAIERGK